MVPLAMGLKYCDGEWRGIIGGVYGHAYSHSYKIGIREKHVGTRDVAAGSFRYIVHRRYCYSCSTELI